MGIKSQQDVKNANRDQRDKIPRSMEGKFPKPPSVIKTSPIPSESTSKELSDVERIRRIELYLEKVDAGFEKIVTELTNLKNILPVIQSIDTEISKLTGDLVRLTKLDEGRYIELVNALNETSQKIKNIDEYLPTYINKRIDEHLNEMILDESIKDSKDSEEETIKE